MLKIKRFFPILLIIAFMITGYFAGWYETLNFQTLKYHHNQLTEYVNSNPIITPIIYMAAYACSTALSIPGGFFLSLIGGFLFKQPWALIYVLIGATLGATTLFFAAKTALGDVLRKRAGPFTQKMQDGFAKNPVPYLLFLRFVPLFPFWLVNIAPAFFPVRIWTYIWTTFVGIAPGAFVTTQTGRGLGVVFETADEFSIGAVFNVEMTIALVCLGIFALLPIVVKKIMDKRK